MPEHEFRVDFDLGAFRHAAAKYVKLLIRARWKDEPRFLSDQTLDHWNLLEIKDDRHLANRIPSWRLLEEAAGALGILNTEFLPRCGSGGIPVINCEKPEFRLMEEIAFLADQYGDYPHHNGTLLTAAKRRREGARIDWDTLVDWPRLPAIRADLDLLPHPTRGAHEGPGKGTESLTSQGTPPSRFPKLDGLRWNEVTIKFVSNDSVRITARGIRRTLSFSEMGFRDSRKADSPDQQWILLKYMARNGGELRWNDPNPPPDQSKAKHKIKHIRKRISEVLHIDNDPFEPYRKFGCYKSRFILIGSPDEQVASDEKSTTED